MTAHPDPRAELTAWILQRSVGLTPERLTGATPLLADRHLTSLQLPELLLVLEALRGEPIDVAALAPGDLRDLDTICDRFLAGSPTAGVSR